MKAIIFGINGQDGFYLKKLLINKGVEVLGVSRRQGDITGDIGDFNLVSKIIKEHQPDYVFHFAAESTTKHEAIFKNHSAISTGTLNLLESVKSFSARSKVFLSGSAMQFKNEGIPIHEQTPFAASSTYAISRIHSVYAARYFRDTFNLNIYVGYFFNHDSPLRSERHINQKIIQAVKRISAGSNEKIVLGDISVRKEFNFASDIMEATWILVNQETYFEVVIGSGKAFAISDLLDYCFKKIEKEWESYVIKNEYFIHEYQILVSDPKLIYSLEWHPKVSFEELAEIMWNGTY